MKYLFELFTVVLFLVICVPFVSAFSGLGSGTLGDPFQITTLSELNETRDNLTASYILMNDIDASATSSWDSGAGWLPVGNGSQNSFNGTFDGSGYTISHLYINRSQIQQGFFSYLRGNVSNVTFTNATVEGLDHVGVLAGGVNGASGNPSRIYFASSIGRVFGTNFLGGIVGSSYYLNLSSSFAVVNITGTRGLGGLIGSSDESSIHFSSAQSTLIVSSTYAGGLVGEINCFAPYTITDSYAQTNITGSSYAGGLVGLGSDLILINRSYAQGTIYLTGSNPIGGGLIGDSYNSDCG